MARRSRRRQSARRNESRARRGGNSESRTLENLREMGEHVANAAVQALKNGAYKIADDAKRLAPVKTGKLRNSIHVEENRVGNSFKIVADAETNGYHYAKVVEFSPKINKPFMYPAMDMNRQQIYANVKNAASAAIARGS